MKPVVFFFRGLSTYSRETLGYGPLSTPMHLVYERALAAKFEFHPVFGMGSGMLTEIISRARASLLAHAAWTRDERPAHFVGHSAGGLVARTLAEEFAPRVMSCLTIASPHRGSRLAESCLTLPESYARATRVFGYDLTAKKRFFAEFTRAAIARHFAQEAAAPGLRRASLVCASAPRDWCLPLRVLHALPALESCLGWSDGIIEAESQPYGEVVGTVAIDHLRQFGLFGGARRFAELARLIEKHLLV